MNSGAEELDDDEVVTEWVTPFGKVTLDPKKGTTKTEYLSLILNATGSKYTVNCLLISSAVGTVAGYKQSIT